MCNLNVDVLRAVLASQTIITMLPSSPQVQTVYAQANGIIPTLRSLPPDAARNTLCIDSTTLDVKIARDVAADVLLTGADIVDAPVSGGACICGITVSSAYEKIRYFVRRCDRRESRHARVHGRWHTRGLYTCRAHSSVHGCPDRTLRALRRRTWNQNMQ